MTRIAPVPEKGSGPIVRASYRQARRMTGAVPDPVAVMAHSPAVLMTYGALETGVKRQRRVDERLKELAWMKAATLMGCAWCIDFGQMELAALGVGEDLLAELPDHRASDRFDEREKLVFDLVEGMTATPVDVPADLITALREHFDDADLVELVFAIAVENLRGRFNWALGIEAQGFADGSACVVRT